MIERKHGKYYTCKRLKLLQYLLEHGYEPIETIPDVNNWKYKNWVFENTGADFEQCVNNYFGKLKAN